MSPALIKTSLIVPACVDGTSMVALSVSSVIRPSSFSTVSPADTSTSITSTSPSSPISGTATSIVSLPADAAGADSCFALSGAAGADASEEASLDADSLEDEPEPATSSLITTVPSFTLSPVLMNTSFTVPACVEGTSMVALSVSRVISPSSFSMVSPTETNTSITSTSSSEPISGTATSITSLLPDAAGAASDLLSSFGASCLGASSLEDSSEAFSSDAPSSALSPLATFISPITSPSLILSPTDTDRLTISPSNGAGMSIDALSLSTVTTPSSASMLSPTATHSSITSTSSPPTSGTIIF